MDGFAGTEQAEFDRRGSSTVQPVRSARIVGVEVQRYEIDRDDRATWDRHPPTGMRSSKKHHAFAPILGPIMTGALDDLFGPERWMPPKHYGQVLITANATGEGPSFGTATSSTSTGPRGCSP